MDTEHARRALMSDIEVAAFDCRITMNTLFRMASVSNSILTRWRMNDVPTLSTIGKLEAALATHKETE
jgi:hypothetical protein